MSDHTIDPAAAAAWYTLQNARAKFERLSSAARINPVPCSILSHAEGMDTLPASNLGQSAPVSVGSLLWVEGPDWISDCRFIRALDGAEVSCVSDLYDCRFVVEVEDGERGVISGWLADTIEVLP